MSKQMLKSLTMLTLVIGLALATAVVPANGQLTSSRVTAVIPFDFIVGGKTLPSGKYTVSAVTNDGEGLRITSRDGKSALRLSNLITDNGKNGKARMVFHRYGQQYFLAEVWSDGNYGRQLRPSKRESNLRRELASNASKSDSGKGSYEIVEVAVVR